MSKEEKLNKCIKLLQTEGKYSTEILTELLQLDLLHNDGKIVEGLEHDVWVLDNVINKGE